MTQLCCQLSENELKELTDLASDRAGDAANSVLQLVDDPLQAASVSAIIALHMLRLAGLFAHTAHIIEGSDKPHEQVVNDLMAMLANKMKTQPPTPRQLHDMHQFRSHLLRLRNHNL